MSVSRKRIVISWLVTVFRKRPQTSVQKLHIIHSKPNYHKHSTEHLLYLKLNTPKQHPESHSRGETMKKNKSILDAQIANYKLHQNPYS